MLASTVTAQPPMPNVAAGGNKWLITGYDDTTTDNQPRSSHIICFLPFNQNIGGRLIGKWYSLTFPDWNGNYYQVGDKLRMTGDFRTDIGGDSITLLHTANNANGQVNAMEFKDWTEWLGDYGYGVVFFWGNATMERIGKCNYPFNLDDYPDMTWSELFQLEQEALSFSQNLPERLLMDGYSAAFPATPNMESVDTYLERNGFN